MGWEPQNLCNLPVMNDLAQTLIHVQLFLGDDFPKSVSRPKCMPDEDGDSLAVPLFQ